jgi:hypothetical protein
VLLLLQLCQWLEQVLHACCLCPSVAAAVVVRWLWLMVWTCQLLPPAAAAAGLTMEAQAAHHHLHPG